MFRYKLRIALLSLGTIAGFASGFASMGRCHYERRQAFEHHVAKVCVDAAKDATPREKWEK
jgi:hypothetical protein